MSIHSVFSEVVTRVNPTTEAVLGVTTNVAKHLTRDKIPPIQPMEALVDIGVKPLLMEVLALHFIKEGLEVATATKVAYDACCEHQYTALRAAGHETALLQLPHTIFELPNNYLGPFVILLKVFRGLSIRFFSEGVQGLRKMFQNAYEDEKGRNDWQFINWVNITDFQEGVVRFTILEVFELNSPNVGTLEVLGNADVQRIIGILTRQAMSAPPNVGVGGYFRNLVSRSGWPEKWEGDVISGWTGSAGTDARTFIDYVMGKELFPVTHEKHGDSVLGWVLLDLLRNQEISSPNDKWLATIILHFKLIQNQAAVDELRERYG